MIRIVSLNIWQEQGPWEKRLELVKRELPKLKPDVICLQEVREVSGKIPNQAEALARSFGMEFVYETAQEWGGGLEGLAILSRHSIAKHVVRELPFSQGSSRRICLGASIITPDGSTWVFNTHLAYRPIDGVMRERQVHEVDRFVRECQGDATVVLLAGDFNTVPDSDEMRFLRGLTSIQGERTYYQDAFATCNPGDDGITWSSANPYTKSLEWLPSDRRLDYIFVSARRKNGSGTIYACRLVLTEPDEH
ncbi:MAG: endonuclease/exonuclease/phosphatase family protein, partial [Pseudomonadota bacterium]